MSGDTRAYRLRVSHCLFELATEGIRLRSNETRRFQTLSSVVNARAAGRMSGFKEQDVPTLKDHFSAIPTKGPIPISLTITKTNAQSLDEAKERLAKLLGTDLTVGDAVSLLLLDYIAQAKADRMVAKFESGELSPNRDELRNKSQSDSTVVRLR